MSLTVNRVKIPNSFLRTICNSFQRTNNDHSYQSKFIITCARTHSHQNQKNSPHNNAMCPLKRSDVRAFKECLELNAPIKMGQSLACRSQSAPYLDTNNFKTKERKKQENTKQRVATKSSEQHSVQPLYSHSGTGRTRRADSCAELYLKGVVTNMYGSVNSKQI